MSDTQKLVAVLKWVGWTDIAPSRHNPDRFFGHYNGTRKELPTLTLDLCAEMEAKVVELSVYYKHLHDMRGGEWGFATKEERLDALILTFGLEF